jgi:hypothetical protein
MANEIRSLMARNGIQRLADVIGRRNLLEKRTDLAGKAALLDVGHIVGAPPARAAERDDAEQRRLFAPKRREEEERAAHRAAAGEDVLVKEPLTNVDRCVGVGGGILARRFGGWAARRAVVLLPAAPPAFYRAYVLG